MGLAPDADPMDVCRDYVDTVTANIKAFLRGKSRAMTVRMESGADDFVDFWERIGASGNLPAALAEWEIRHNAGGPAC
jgi:hypothetical protein